MPTLLRLSAVLIVLTSIMLFASAQARALSLMDPFNIPGTLDANVAVVGKDLPYGENARNMLDVYAPEGGASDAPVVVFIYGGAWKQGSKEDYPFAGHAFAAKGFVTVIPDYRLVPEVAYPDFINDNARAIKWVEDNISQYGGDPQQVYLVGHSAGAYDAVMLGMDISYLRDAGVTIPLRGVAGISGPYAVYPFEFVELQNAFGHVDNPQLTQPINMPTLEAVPMFLAHGGIDLIVSPENTVKMQHKFFADNRSINAKIYGGLGHMEAVIALSSVWRWRSPVLDDIVAFFNARGAFDPDSFGPIELLSKKDKNLDGGKGAATGDGREMLPADGMDAGMAEPAPEPPAGSDIFNSALQALEAAAQAGGI